MNKNYFEIIRAGINSTFQDLGRNHLYHIGIPFSGAMDNRNYLLANKLTGNNHNDPVIEFAYQGPHLKYHGDKINSAITGDVSFKIKKGDDLINGECYQSFILENNDELDILSTNKSVYGYIAISGTFDLQFQWSSCSTNTKAKIGSNNGEKLSDNQKITIKEINNNFVNRKLNYVNTKIENIVDTNIRSEGLIKGVIQVPADGNPIIMLSDHGTIGGYPKIGVVVSADYDKLVQLTPGSTIKFQEVDLNSAETLFKLYDLETQNLISQI